MKKILIAIIVILVLGAGGYYLYQHNQAKAPGEELNGSQQTAAPEDNFPAAVAPSAAPQENQNPPTSTPAKPGGTFSNGEGEPVGPNIQVVEMDFDGTQFSPATVNIKVNDYVFFKNKSNVNFWPASNPHPAHTDYPGFDALKPIAPGGEYKFQFTKVGNWGFHDHLNHAIGGTVIVTK